MLSAQSPETRPVALLLEWGSNHPISPSLAHLERQRATAVSFGDLAQVCSYRYLVPGVVLVRDTGETGSGVCAFQLTSLGGEITSINMSSEDQSKRGSTS
jgi:hypothetical protein